MQYSNIKFAEKYGDMSGDRLRVEITTDGSGDAVFEIEFEASTLEFPIDEYEKIHEFMRKAYLHYTRENSK